MNPKVSTERADTIAKPDTEIEIDSWINCVPCNHDDPSLSLQSPHGGRRDPTPTSCALTSAHIPWHVHTYTLNICKIIKESAVVVCACNGSTDRNRGIMGLDSQPV